MRNGTVEFSFTTQKVVRGDLITRVDIFRNPNAVVSVPVFFFYFFLYSFRRDRLSFVARVFERRVHDGTRPTVQRRFT